MWGTYLLRIFQKFPKLCGDGTQMELIYIKNVSEVNIFNYFFDDIFLYPH